MSTLLHWFTSSEWAQIVKALLHSLWQGAVVALVLAVVMRRLANPVSRYRCSLAALVVVVVAGMMTWAVINSSERQKPAPLSIQPIAQSQTAPDYIPPMNLDSPDKIVVIATRPPVATSLRWTAWLALVWLAGAAAMLTRAGVKVAGAEKLRRSCRPLNDERVEKLLSEARRAIGLAKKVRIGVTDKLTSPAVVGLFVPMLILPLSLMTTLTPEQIQFVLLHELAHIRRGDYLANLFQFFAESLLFFNPAVWWISHQVRREREACCDALAIELSGAPVDYARTLVHVAEKMMQPAPAAAMSLGNKREPSSLIDRVQRLLVPGYRPSLRLTWRAMLAALVLGGVLLVLSATGTRLTVAAIITPTSSPTHATNDLAQTSSTIQTNLMSAELAAVVKQDAEKPLDATSLDKTVRDYEARVKDVERNYIQASEKEGILKLQLGVPYNFSTGSTNLSEELKSRYKPYFEAQQATDALRLNLSMGQAVSRVLRSKLNAMQLDAQIPRTTNTGIVDGTLYDKALDRKVRDLEDHAKETQLWVNQAKEKLTLLKTQLGVPDNYADGSTNISEELKSRYKPYLDAQTELTLYLRTLDLQTKQAVYFRTTLQSARDEELRNKTNGPPRTNLSESPSTNHLAQTTSTVQTNLMSERTVAVVKQDAEWTSLQKQDAELRVEIEIANERLKQLRQDLGMPDKVWNAVMLEHDTNKIVQMFQTDPLRQYLPFVQPRLEFGAKQDQEMKLQMQLAATKLDTTSPRQTSSRRDAVPNNLKDIQQMVEDLNRMKIRIKPATDNLALLKERLGVPDNYSVAWTNIPIEIRNSYKPYLDARQELENLNASINSLARELDSTVASNKFEATTLLQDGKLLYEMGRLDQAEAKLNQAITASPTDESGRQASRYLILIQSARIKKLNSTTNSPPGSNLSESPSVITNAESRIVPNRADEPQLRTMTFRIDTYTGFANLQKESGLPETSSRKEQLQKLFAQAGITPPLTNILVTDEGMLVVRGTKEQMDSVNKIVMRLNGTASNVSISVTRVRTNPPSINEMYSSAGRRAVATNLYNIRLDSVHFDNEPLSVVLSNLTQRVKELDPQKQGVNFILETNIASLAVTIVPPMINARVVDVLNATIKNEHSIKYSLEDYGVVFSRMTGEEGRELFTRTFKVDPNTFIAKLSKQTGVTSTNLADSLSALGVKINPPKSMFFNDRSGILVVRASAEDLDIIETLVQALNYSAPIINIKAEFIEVRQSPGNGYDFYLGSVMSPTNFAAGRNSTSNTPTMVFPSGSSPININPQTTKLLGVLPPAQANTVRAALKSNPRAVVVAAPTVTTLSGRQAQIQMGDVLTIVKGINPLALTRPGITKTNENDPAPFLLEQMLFGTMLDVVPHLSADGYTIHLTVIPKVTAFLGYDKPATNVTTYVNGKSQSTPPPQPKLYSDSLTNSVVVWDGQTLVMGGMISEEKVDVTDKVPVLGDLPGFLGRAFRSKSSTTIKKNVFVFITPTLIDPAGNRIHTDEDMPFTKDSIPVQIK